MYVIKDDYPDKGTNLCSINGKWAQRGFIGSIMLLANIYGNWIFALFRDYQVYGSSVQCCLYFNLFKTLCHFCGLNLLLSLTMRKKI